MKRLWLLLLILPMLMGMTPQEAEVIYTDLECYVEVNNETGCNKYKCPKLQDAILHYDESWDSKCIPEWCNLPLQDCSLPPLTGGKDSCGEPCSKPSPEWSHCLLDGIMTNKEF